MDKEFRVEHKGDHILVELSPEFEVKEEHQERFWERLREACDAHDTRRVLVEGPTPQRRRTTEEVIEAGKQTAAVPDMWLAFHLDDFVRTEQSELFEVIAASHGVRVRFFSDSESALQWLRKNAPA